MPDITWKRTGTMLRKMFHILMQAPDGMRAADVLARVAEGETLTEYEAGNCQHCKNYKQDLRDTRSAGCDAAKTEQRRNDRDNEKDDGVVQHVGYSRTTVPVAMTTA